MGVSGALERPSDYPTYSALGARGARPSDYEIATSQLHYYVGRGFEVDVPLRAWYARYQAGSRLRCGDWERFADPEQTTYSAYTARACDGERALDQLVQRAAASGDPGRLPEAWRASLAEVLGPLRYPLHGMHMVACYIGQMAPSGRITATSLFQAGDELRRIDRLAYRTRQLQELAPEFACDARARWENAPAWQPLREAIERLLVSYDWGEAFAALNLCLKPLFDALIVQVLAERCAAADDEVLAAILRSFARDAAHQRAWSRALVAIACAPPAGARADAMDPNEAGAPGRAPGPARDARSDANPAAHTPASPPAGSEPGAQRDTRAALASWIETWRPRVARAIEALAPSFGAGAQSLAELAGAHRAWLASLPGVAP